MTNQLTFSLPLEYGQRNDIIRIHYGDEFMDVSWRWMPKKIRVNPKTLPLQPEVIEWLTKFFWDNLKAMGYRKEVGE